MTLCLKIKEQEHTIGSTSCNIFGRETSSDTFSPEEAGSWEKENHQNMSIIENKNTRA